MTKGNGKLKRSDAPKLDASAIRRDVRAREALAAPEANMPDAPKSVPGNWRVLAYNGVRRFANARPQFPTTPEMAGALFIADAENPMKLLAAFAPGTWSEFMRMDDPNVAEETAEAAPEQAITQSIPVVALETQTVAVDPGGELIGMSA